MGWDAETNARLERSGEDLQIANPEIREIFRKAEEKARRYSGGFADGYLHLAGLDCSGCAKILEKALGLNCYSERRILPSEIRRLNRKANWEIPYDDPCDYWSAKMFMKAVEKSKLTLWFSF